MWASVPGAFVESPALQPVIYLTEFWPRQKVGHVVHSKVMFQDHDQITFAVLALAAGAARMIWAAGTLRTDDPNLTIRTFSI